MLLCQIYSIKKIKEENIQILSNFFQKIETRNIFLFILWGQNYFKTQIKTLQENYTQISFMKVKVRVAQLCPTLCDPMDYTVHDSPGQNTGVGSLSLLQGTFPTQGSNPCLPHCRWILYQLSHKGSPRIQEGVAYPFSSRSSRPRNLTRVSCTAGGFCTNWAMREAHLSWIYM